MLALGSTLRQCQMPESNRDYTEGVIEMDLLRELNYDTEELASYVEENEPILIPD